jgi:hypothetical protein
LEGYYLIAATHTTQVATLGSHTIRRVDETRLIPIVNPALVKIQKKADEAQYVAAFQAIALQQDLYFSCTYDVTQTLQHNIFCFGRRAHKEYSKQEQSEGTEGTYDGLCASCQVIGARNMASCGRTSLPLVQNCGMFTWNSFLIEIASKGFEVNENDETMRPSVWFVPVIQGFVSQVKISVLGRPIYVTLIARRSRKYAGARFLKRGGDLEGWVANEVESEQIVHDGSQLKFPDIYQSFRSTKPHYFYHATNRSDLRKSEICMFCRGYKVSNNGTVCAPYPSGLSLRGSPYTSFVQHRGSIPLHWSQDNSAMTPKPPIICTFSFRSVPFG